MKFYKRDPNAALAGMAELTMKQRGAYNSLLDLLYSRDGDVPDDDARVARMLSFHWREWAVAKKQLMDLGKVWSEGGKLHARRVQDTLKEAADFSQEQSKRASKGWQERRKVSKNNDPVMPPGNANTATATPTPNKEDTLFSEDENKGVVTPFPSSDSETIEKQYYREGRELFGANAGGLLNKVLRANDMNFEAMLKLLRTSAEMGDPKSYFSKAGLHKRDADGRPAYRKPSEETYRERLAREDREAEKTQERLEQQFNQRKKSDE